MSNTSENIRYTTAQKTKLSSFTPISISPAYPLLGDDDDSCLNYSYKLPTLFEEYREEIVKFKVRPDDIWIISFPRAGAHWTKEMTWILLNDLNFCKSKEIPLGIRCPFLESIIFRDLSENPKNNANSMEIVDQLQSPRIIQTHLPAALLPQELWTVKPKIIYTARNPKDVAISTYNCVKSYYKFDVPFDLFQMGFRNSNISYSPYFKHLLDFWEISKIPNSNVYFNTFEEMTMDLLGVLRKVSKFLNKQSYTDEQFKEAEMHLQFNTMSVNNPTENLVGIFEKPDDNDLDGKQRKLTFFRKGKAGTFKEEMTEDMIKTFDVWTEQQLKDSDFKFSM